MKKNLVLFALLTLTASQTLAAPTVAHPNQSITELANSSGTFTTYGGLMKDGDTLYYGNYNTIQSYNLSSGTKSQFSTLPDNADTKALGKAGSTMYIAMDTNYNAPYPSNLGTFNSTGFTPTMSSGTTDGQSTWSVYDSAVLGNDYYFVGNPGTINTADQQGPTGTRIYKYNTSNPYSPIEIANIGGTSGGLIFDAVGNMYYASQNTGEGVLKFDAADVLTGGLDASDGTTIADITAGGLGFLSTGELLATTGYGQLLSTYDVATGEKIGDIASTEGSDFIGKFVVGEDDSIYVTSTDWNSYDSTLSTIAVPEPASVMLILLGSLSIAGYRRLSRIYGRF